MKKFINIFLLVIAMSLCLVGCGENQVDIQNNLERVEESNLPQIQEPVVPANPYEKITAADAKKIMDESENYIILDVRNLDEYNEGHIPDAVLLPVDNIETEAGPVIGDKNKMILVYCRSGNRSKMASNKLVELGYTNIKDFGGIIDWPYEVVVK